MDQALWNKVLKFDMDGPPSADDFSTRLAKENLWTISFTKNAILEYKKFMFLAATSNTMISPSPIVDIVWHQHLIFTTSYQDFCQLLGNFLYGSTLFTASFLPLYTFYDELGNITSNISDINTYEGCYDICGGCGD